MLVIFVGCHRQIAPEFQQNIFSGETVVPYDNSIRNIQKKNFEPLKSKETLHHEIEVGNAIRHLKIYAVADDIVRELLVFPIAYSRNYENEIQYSQSGKRMVFQCKSDSPEVFELWFLDGDNGTAKALFSTLSTYDFKIDDSGELLCIYEGIESSQSEVPILHIYEIAAMQEIKRVVYEPYRNKGMYPVAMSFEDDAFMVILSADTVDFTTLEISIIESEEYRVVESYSWQEENER
jgi:hypothetical protein